MGFDGTVKRLAVFAVMRLLGINDLRGRLSQNPQMTNRRAGGAAILAAHHRAAKQGSTESDLTHRTLQFCRK